MVWVLVLPCPAQGAWRAGGVTFPCCVQALPTGSPATVTAHQTLTMLLLGRCPEPISWAPSSPVLPGQEQDTNGLTVPYVVPWHKGMKPAGWLQVLGVGAASSGLSPKYHGEGCSEQQSACPSGRGDWRILCRDGHSPPLAGWRFHICEQRLFPTLSCSVCLRLSQPGKFILLQEWMHLSSSSRCQSW